MSEVDWPPATSHHSIPHQRGGIISKLQRNRQRQRTIDLTTRYT